VEPPPWLPSSGSGCRHPSGGVRARSQAPEIPLTAVPPALLPLRGSINLGERPSRRPRPDSSWRMWLHRPPPPGGSGAACPRGGGTATASLSVSFRRGAWRRVGCRPAGREPKRRQPAPAVAVARTQLPAPDPTRCNLRRPRGGLWLRSQRRYPPSWFIPATGPSPRSEDVRLRRRVQAHPVDLAVDNETLRPWVGRRNARPPSRDSHPTARPRFAYAGGRVNQGWLAVLRPGHVRAERHCQSRRGVCLPRGAGRTGGGARDGFRLLRSDRCPHFSGSGASPLPAGGEVSRRVCRGIGTCGPTIECAAAGPDLPLLGQLPQPPLEVVDATLDITNLVGASRGLRVTV
jgi:hypothetical protein